MFASDMSTTPKNRELWSFDGEQERSWPTALAPLAPYCRPSPGRVITWGATRVTFRGEKSSQPALAHLLGS